jgi:hypothetical protein
MANIVAKKSRESKIAPIQHYQNQAMTSITQSMASQFLKRSITSKTTDKSQTHRPPSNQVSSQ